MNPFERSYKSKCISPQEIAGLIRSGQHIYTDIALSQPPAILRALGARAEQGGLEQVSVNTILELEPLPCYDPAFRGTLNGISWFCGAPSRSAVNGGGGDVLPAYYRDFPRVVRDAGRVDVFCAAVSPMDRHGYFSLSTVGSISEAALERAEFIFLEVNDNLPRALRAPMVHISQVTALCEHTRPLPCLPPAEIDEASRTIGELIASEIPDGATLQLGIGAIPDAVGLALRSKRHLGLHTEMFTDSMVELLLCGAADNSAKPIHRGKTVTTFAFGSQRIYDYIHDNPSIEFMPVDYVNAPDTIARHPDFMSVNAALEVDFFGQVCAESVGTRIVSGTGGQADYVRGARLSHGGKSFIAFPSTAQGGKASRIVSTLAPGSLVSTSKNDVDFIVTEFGIARLRGRPLSQRTKSLIAIAHPNFRDQLTFEAKRRNILI